MVWSSRAIQWECFQTLQGLALPFDVLALSFKSATDLGRVLAIQIYFATGNWFTPPSMLPPH